MAAGWASSPLPKHGRSIRILASCSTTRTAGQLGVGFARATTDRLPDGLDRVAS